MAGISDAAHLCIDMQNILAKGGVWETPWMERVLPIISAICARYPERTVFTRFITPQRSDDRRGQWQTYYGKWQRATREQLAPGALDIVPALARYSPPALVVDKPAYSAFFGSRLGHLLVEKHIGTVVVTGADRCLRALDRAWCRRSRLPGRHGGGRPVQFLGRRARCADDHVPGAVSRTDRPRHRRGTVRPVASGLGGAAELPVRLRR